MARSMSSTRLLLAACQSWTRPSSMRQGVQGRHWSGPQATLATPPILFCPSIIPQVDSVFVQTLPFVFLTDRKIAMVEAEVECAPGPVEGLEKKLRQLRRLRKRARHLLDAQCEAADSPAEVDEEISLLEEQDALRHLPKKKAAGMDGIAVAPRSSSNPAATQDSPEGVPGWCLARRLGSCMHRTGSEAW